MLDLTQKALARMEAGGKSNSSSGDGVHPFKDALKEAFEAVKKDDFDGFTSALESALNIHLADREGSQRDVPPDVESYELDEAGV